MEIFMCLINITIKFRNGQKEELWTTVAGGNGEGSIINKVIHKVLC
jgi:hypothetical protein